MHTKLICCWCNPWCNLCGDTRGIQHMLCRLCVARYVAQALWCKLWSAVLGVHTIWTLKLDTQVGQQRRVGARRGATEGDRGGGPPRRATERGLGKVATEGGHGAPQGCQSLRFPCESPAPILLGHRGGATEHLKIVNPVILASPPPTNSPLRPPPRLFFFLLFLLIMLPTPPKRRHP